MINPYKRGDVVEMSMFHGDPDSREQHVKKVHTIRKLGSSMLLLWSDYDGQIGIVVDYLYENNGYKVLFGHHKISVHKRHLIHSIIDC